MFAIAVQAFDTEIRVTVGGKNEGPHQAGRVYTFLVVLHVNDYVGDFGETLRNKPGSLFLLHPFQFCITSFTISHFSPFI